MPSIKEIAKAAKSEIKASKEDKNITIENVKKNSPSNCSILLDALLRWLKFDRDFSDLAKEIKELTPNLEFSINDDPKKYRKEIENLYNDKYPDKPGLRTSGIVLADIYYTRKTKKEDSILGGFTEIKIIRIAAIPQGKIDVKNKANHRKLFDKVGNKELANFFKGTKFYWEEAILSGDDSDLKRNSDGVKGFILDTNTRKCKNYKDMMTKLTKFLIKDVSSERHKIINTFKNITRVTGFVNKLLGIDPFEGAREILPFARNMSFPAARWGEFSDK